jgi:hypothetical protein
MRWGSFVSRDSCFEGDRRFFEPLARDQSHREAKMEYSKKEYVRRSD